MSTNSFLGRKKKNAFKRTCLVVTTREQRQFADYLKMIEEPTTAYSSEEERAKMLKVAYDLFQFYTTNKIHVV